jgi:S-adenosylmethionine synthetase
MQMPAQLSPYTQNGFDDFYSAVLFDFSLPQIVREVLKDLGFDDDSKGLNYKDVPIMVRLQKGPAPALKVNKRKGYCC